MQLKSETTDHDKMADKVLAAMETGNINQARSIMNEYKDLYPAEGCALQTQVLNDYGIFVGD